MRAREPSFKAPREQKNAARQEGSRTFFKKFKNTFFIDIISYCAIVIAAGNFQGPSGGNIAAST
jgi:hypothetical protein